MTGRLTDSIIRELSKRALEARKMAYAPYSHFRVGACLLCADGTMFSGCNIENAAFGPTNCAERTAIFKAVSEGHKSFTAIAIAGGKESAAGLDFCSPCGVCRQVMREFCRDDFVIILACSEEEYRLYTLGELLPESFVLETDN